MSVNSECFKVQRIHKLASGGKVLAFADVNFNDEILVKGLRVVQGAKGIFVTMPQEKGKDDRWYNTVECLSETTSKAVFNCVLQAYKEN